MTPERWQKINEVFQSVIELDPVNQQAYLNAICDGDDSLRKQVETLLEANKDAGTFIAGNAANDVGHLIDGASAKSLSGSRLGHYEIQSELGSGGMGKVYLARDSKLNRAIAVKILPPSFSGQSDYVKRFKTEAKAAATLNHPNVATIHSVEETDDRQFYITMEYVEGKSLSEATPADGVDLKTFLDWFIPLADALAHAHAKGIVHRDVKPSNIIITPSGIPKILDFGLARIERVKVNGDDSTVSLTKTGQILGTPAYMSPEQAEGKETDHRTDIFSFAILMYETLTGQRPFRGSNYASIVSEVLTKSPQPVSDLKPEIPYLLSRLIMKCLNKKAQYRYQSMEEVRLILEEIRFAADSGSSFLRQPAWGIGPQNRYYPWLLGAGGLLIVLSAFAAWFWFGDRASSGRTVSRFYVESPDDVDLSILEAKISPDGKNLLFTTFSDAGRLIYLRPLDSFKARPIEGSELGRLPFFSPDGNWIGFTTGGNTIKKVPVDGGTPLSICEPCPTVRFTDWGADGNVYFATNDGLFRVASDGGKPESLTKVDKAKGESDHYLPHLLPDRSSVLFTVQRKEGPKLAILSLQTKQWKYLEEAGEAWFGKYVSTGHILFARDQQLMALEFDARSNTVTGKPILLLGDLFAMAPNFEVSDSGTLIYLPTISRSKNVIVWVDRKGVMTPVFDKQGDYTSPRLSPDGNRIAVRLNSDIWVYEIKTGKGVRITFNGKNEIPLWSLDGKSVYYASEKDGEFSINRKNADGSGSEVRIHTSKNRITPYSLHPTEPVLAFADGNAQGDRNVMVKSLTDGSKQDIVVTEFREDTPRFSSDGKWLAYFSMDSEQPQIYVRPWAGDDRKLLVSKDGGMFPVWSPANNEIFYRLGNRIFSAQVRTSPDFEVLSNSLLFSGPFLTSYDVTPDGQRFLMVKDEHGTLPKKLSVVVNWTDEVKRIVGETNK